MTFLTFQYVHLACTVQHAQRESIIENSGKYDVLPEQNKMSAFHAQNPTQTYVWHGQKLTLHHILKIKKRKVPQIFCFFSMVWGVG